MSPKDPPITEIATSSSTTSRSSSVVSELRATSSMCHHCFDVLIHALHNKNKASSSHTKRQVFDPDPISLLPVIDETKKPEFVDELPIGETDCPLFITWDKVREPTTHQQQQGSTFELRGCIGTHSPKPLHPSIGEYALISAFKDKRFQPVSLVELPLLRVAVSLLVRYEPCEHCHDWTVGVHGVIIVFVVDEQHRGGKEYSATYLPEVASDQGWDQATAIESLIRKSGYHGRITPTLLQRLQCTRYQSSKTRVTFDEYIQVRGEAVARLLQVTSTEDAAAANGDGKNHIRSHGSGGRDSSTNCIIS